MNRRNLLSGVTAFAPRSLCSVGEEGASATGGGGTTTSSSPATGSNAASSPGASGAPPASAAPSSSPASGTPTPSVQTGSTPAAEGAADSFNFDEIFTTTEAKPPGAEPSATPAAQPGTQPEAKPAAAGEEPAKPEAKPEGASAAPAAPGPGGEQSPSPSPTDPVALGRALVEHEAEAITHLATSQFKLTEAETKALEDDPVAAIPTLLAKVAVKAQQNVFATLAKILPAFIEGHSRAAKANTEAEEQFFSLHKSLNKAAHGADVARVARAYRAANPQVPREQMMKDVGMMVMMQHGISPGASTAGPGTPMNGTPPGAPRPPQPSPWQPAGATPAVSSTPVEGNPWDILGQTEAS